MYEELETLYRACEDALRRQDGSIFDLVPAAPSDWTEEESRRMEARRLASSGYFPPACGHGTEHVVYTDRGRNDAGSRCRLCGAEARTSYSGAREIGHHWRFVGRVEDGPSALARVEAWHVADGVEGYGPPALHTLDGTIATAAERCADILQECRDDLSDDAPWPSAVARRETVPQWCRA